MRCWKCKTRMEYKKNLQFNQYKIDGWQCGKCGEEYFEPAQAQRILLLNKLKHKGFELKLNRVKSNLILRIPKEVGEAMNLNEKSIVTFMVKNGKEILIKT